MVSEGCDGWWAGGGLREVTGSCGAHHRVLRYLLQAGNGACLPCSVRYLTVLTDHRYGIFSTLGLGATVELRPDLFSHNQLLPSLFGRTEETVSMCSRARKT